MGSRLAISAATASAPALDPQVARERDAGAELRQLLGGGGHGGFLAGDDVHLGAGQDEALGEHLADAARPAGDDGDLAVDGEQLVDHVCHGTPLSADRGTVHQRLRRHPRPAGGPWAGQPAAVRKAAGWRPSGPASPSHPTRAALHPAGCGDAAQRPPRAGVGDGVVVAPRRRFGPEAVGVGVGRQQLGHAHQRRAGPRWSGRW